MDGQAKRCGQLPTTGNLLFLLNNTAGLLQEQEKDPPNPAWVSEEAMD